jgi:putative photosynthetic complex assembly protein
MNTPASSVATTSGDPLRPGIVKGIGIAILCILTAVTAVRLSGVDIRSPDAPAVAVRELRFYDRADGSVAVIDAASNLQIHRFVGESGFVRGTLRGLARDRQRAGIGPEPAFELIGRADGRLTLKDPATGRVVDLESFGPTNAAAFAQLMAAKPNNP